MAKEDKRMVEEQEKSKVKGTDSPSVSQSRETSARQT